MRQIPTGADRLLVVLSDVEMGAGGVLDDFPHSAWLASLLASYDQEAYRGLAIDLVFNGDTFDFLKTSVEGRYPRHVTVATALAKLDRVIGAHPRFVEALERFLGGGDRAVHFVVGNHDPELLFPGVQTALADAIGRPGVSFPGFSLQVGDVRIEHGSQVDPMFAMNEQQPLVEWQGHTLLDLPWGSVALLDVVMPMHSAFFALDRVKPRRRVFDLLPEVREVVSGAFWRYFTREYLVDLWNRSDPTRKASWAMLKDVAYRFTTHDPISSGTLVEYQRLVTDADDTRLVLVGHTHTPSWWSFADRKILQTGCLRDEYVIDRQGTVVGHLPKVYAEVFLERGRTVRSELVEVQGPPPIVGHVPASILELREIARPMLDTAAERARRVAEEEAHEASEAHDREPPRPG